MVYATGAKNGVRKFVGSYNKCNSIAVTDNFKCLMWVKNSETKNGLYH
jgi:hypothetical protein